MPSRRSRLFGTRIVSTASTPVDGHFARIIVIKVTLHVNKLDGLIVVNGTISVNTVFTPKFIGKTGAIDAARQVTCGG